MTTTTKRVLLTAWVAGFVYMWSMFPWRISAIITVIIGLRVLYGVIYPQK